MKTYELVGEVDEKHELHLVMPPECAPGKVRITITLQDGEIEAKEDDWQKLDDLIAACQMETGVKDLAHEHDYYRLGTPKKNDR